MSAKPAEVAKQETKEITRSLQRLKDHVDTEPFCRVASFLITYAKEQFGVRG